MFRVAQAFALVTLIAAVALSAATAQSGGAPAALSQAIAATEAARVAYAFDLALDTSKQNWRARFDPTANPRLRLLTPAPDTLDNDDRRAFERFAENIEGVSWCANDYMGRIADVRRIREDETTITYAFQPTRESIRSEQSRRFADRMRGEMTMTKENADITRVRIFAPQAFSPMPLVRVEHMNIVIRCMPAPNGRHYAVETTSDMRGSAFGQAFDERSVQRASNLRAP